MREFRSEAIVTVDVHGRRPDAARTTVAAALAQNRGAYRIRVIHGYRHGEVLRTMVRTSFLDDPRVLRVDAVADGVTELVLREV